MKTHGTLSNEGKGSNICGLLLIGQEGVQNCLGYFFLAERYLHKHGMGRIEKTLHMFWQAKNRRAAVLALITANALEDPQAIM
jgi:hypothetical protein